MLLATASGPSKIQHVGSILLLTMTYIHAIIWRVFSIGLSAWLCKLLLVTMLGFKVFSFQKPSLEEDYNGWLYFSTSDHIL